MGREFKSEESFESIVADLIRETNKTRRGDSVSSPLKWIALTRQGGLTQVRQSLVTINP
jgi:hypothetical protein